MPKIRAEKAFVFKQKKPPFLRAAPQIRFFPPDFPCSTPIFFPFPVQTNETAAFLSSALSAPETAPCHWREKRFLYTVPL